MELFLQIWGGVLYLFNKIFLAQAEGQEDGRRWRISGWAVYLAGLPAWVIILVSHQDWIAAAIEAGGAPSMFLGLIVALKGMEEKPKTLEKGAQIVAYSILVLWVGYSLYDFGGITAFSQILEMGVMAGYLVGTWMLARQKPTGWLWFGVMTISMGSLMFMQAKPILGVQQVISLGFVIHGFRRSRRKFAEKG